MHLGPSGLWTCTTRSDTIPFAVVRTISDRADDAAHVDFVRFTKEVASRYGPALARAVFAALPPA